MSREFELILVCGGQVALFDNSRVSDDDCVGLHKYHLRHGDDGSFVTLERLVCVNFGGTVLTSEPIDFDDADYIALDKDSCPDFLGVLCTVEQFKDDVWLRQALDEIGIQLIE